MGDVFIINNSGTRKLEEIQQELQVLLSKDPRKFVVLLFGQYKSSTNQYQTYCEVRTSYLLRPLNSSTHCEQLSNFKSLAAFSLAVLKVQLRLNGEVTQMSLFLLKIRPEDSEIRVPTLLKMN